MHWAEHNGIFFIEGSPPHSNRKQSISTELNAFFSQNHLKSLDDLKDRMAQQAVTSGCNAIIEFKYGSEAPFGRA